MTAKTSESTCPKCGCGNISVEWVAAYRPPYQGGLVDAYKLQPEHLRKTCPTCAYDWKEPAIDKEQP